MRITKLGLILIILGALFFYLKPQLSNQKHGIGGKQQQGKKAKSDKKDKKGKKVKLAEERPEFFFTLQDDAEFLHSPQRLDENLEVIKSLGVTHLRITAGWSSLAPARASMEKPEFDAANPAEYPEEGFENLDRAVKAADRKGIEILMDLAFWAPYWGAQGGEAQGERARTNINPQEFAFFAGAVATRYSGSFTPKDQEAPLPRVDIFSIWNEPNISGFLLPQREAGEPKSPHLYREMVRVAYPAIKGASPESKILVGGLAAKGAYNAKGLESGIPPLEFIREMACVNEKFEPLEKTECQNFTPILGDGWSHHPYSFGNSPGSRSSQNRSDNLPFGELDKLSITLERLAKMRRISPELKSVYITEYGYKTNPPSDEANAVSLKAQARYLLESYYQSWRNPHIKMYAQFLLRDIECPDTGLDACLTWPTGLFFADGQEKLAVWLLKKGLVVEREGKYLMLWFRHLTDERAVVEYKSKRGWRPLGIEVHEPKTYLFKVKPLKATRFRLNYQTIRGMEPGPPVKLSKVK